MKLNLNSIQNYLWDYAYQFSYFGSGDYYSGLLKKYFSVEGFIIGFIFVLLIYFTSSKSKKEEGFFEVLMLIAVINSSYVLIDFIYDVFSPEHRFLTQTIFDSPDNLISGFILTLVLLSNYRRLGKGAFMFGIVTYASLTLLNFSEIGRIDDNLFLQFLTFRIVLIGFISVFICYRRSFFTGWICYFCFHFISRAAWFFIPILQTETDLSNVYNYVLNSNIMEFIPHFTVDAVIFAVVLGFAIVFEKAVLTVQST